MKEIKKNERGDGEPKIQKVAECQSGKNRSHIIEKTETQNTKFRREIP